MARTEYEVTRKTMMGKLQPGFHNIRNKSFPNAPMIWQPEDSVQAARKEGIMELSDDHWEVIRVLQSCYAQEQHPRTRLLHDALEARFSAKGGMRYLYTLYPDGPIAQGCRLTGLESPSGSVDKSFGSVR